MRDADDASNFNSASIAIGDLAGVQTVTRTVTNVGKTTFSVAVRDGGLYAQRGAGFAEHGRDKCCRSPLRPEDRDAECLHGRPSDDRGRHQQRAQPDRRASGRARCTVRSGTGGPCRIVVFGYNGSFWPRRAA